jgi:hypothetical protein
VGGWVGEGEGIGFEFAQGERKTGGEHRFMMLMKSKKKGKNYAVFYFAAKRFFIYIYHVITWEKIKKRLTIHYLRRVNNHSLCK